MPVYEQLRQHIAAYNDARAAKLRAQIILGFFGVLGFFTLAFAAIGSWRWSIGTVALMALTAGAYFLIRGMLDRTYLFGRVTKFIFASRPGDWFVIVVALLLAAVALVVLKLVGVVVIAGVLAAAMVFTLDRMAANERRGPVEQIESLLKSMRRQGMQDASLRQMVCEHGGANWEPIFEAIFGYEAKIEARVKWGVDELGRPKPKDRAWRDTVVRWMDARRSSPPEVKVERAAPTAASKLPMPASEPQAALPEAEPESPPEQPPAPPEAAPPPKPEVEDPTDRIDNEALERDRKRRAYEESVLGPNPRGPLAALLSARIRFILGAALVASSLMWMHQNGMVPGEELRQVINEPNIESLNEERAAGIVQKMDPTLRIEPVRDVVIPYVPASAAKWISGYAPGVAGMILVFSSLFRGVKIALFLYPAAGVVFFGELLPIPPMGPIPAEQMSWAVGGVMTVLGVLFGRVRYL